MFALFDKKRHERSEAELRSHPFSEWDFYRLGTRANKQRHQQATLAFIWSVIYYLIGGAAAVCAALAGAAGLGGNNAELAGIFGLVATGLTALQMTFGEIRNPHAKVAAHLQLEEQFEKLREDCEEAARDPGARNDFDAYRPLNHRFHVLRSEALRLDGHPVAVSRTARRRGNSGGTRAGTRRSRSSSQAKP